MGKPTKIFLVAYPETRLRDFACFAMDEHGDLLTTHISSNRTWAKFDLGLTSQRKHEVYDREHPEGWLLVDLTDLDDPKTVPEFAEALALNHAKYAEPATDVTD